MELRAHLAHIRVLKALHLSLLQWRSGEHWLRVDIIPGWHDDELCLCQEWGSEGVLNDGYNCRSEVNSEYEWSVLHHSGSIL